VVGSDSTIEFASKLYDSLAVGFSLDEAVARARLHVMEWGQRQRPVRFDWGLYMIYMQACEAVMFPRAQTRAVKSHRTRVQREHDATVTTAHELARGIDGLSFGEIMSELSERRVLILGRFSRRRLPILQALKKKLSELPHGYRPELFDYDKPRSRDLVEAIVGFAALSRFIIADLSEPKSIQSELEAIVRQFDSVPVAPVINDSGKEYATFRSIQRKDQVLKPTLRYRSIPDLLEKLESELIPRTEALVAVARSTA